ncbi:HET-domain-containing protein [Thozetella sp. PMI_491]|nr:HET-domain-containing protein [Thozetella sp. PMI_491]
MAQLYQYKRLSNARCTRIIRLHPSRDKRAELKLELCEMPVDQPVSYRALSYTWGGQPSDRKVTCYGKQLLITANAHAALKRLRGGSQACYVWVDAICINQSSTEEKNVQVPLMGEIYSRAKSVAVWLGEGTPESEEAFRFMHTIGRLGRGKARFLYTWNLGASIRNLSMVPKEKRVSFEAGIRLLSDDNPYWTRVWTVQELALGSSCEMYCGDSDPVTFVTFVKALDFTDRYLGPGAKEGSQSPTKEYQSTAEIHFLSHKHRHEITRDTIFHALAEKRATDPRDRIYGLAAISPQVFGSLPVDYASEIKYIYSQAAAAIIGSRNEIVPLFYYACQPREMLDLPTWVPDWRSITTRISTHPLPPIVELLKNPSYRLSDDGLALFLKGQTIDPCLVTVSDPVPQFPSDEQAQEEWYHNVRSLIVQWVSSRVEMLKRDPLVAEPPKPPVIYPVPMDVEATGLYYETALYSLFWPGIPFESIFVPWIRASTSEDSELQTESIKGGLREFAGCTLFITAQGYLGRARAVKDGDAVALLTGSTEPFILRPTEEGNFYLISPAAVRDVYSQGIPKPTSADLVEYCIV